VTQTPAEFKPYFFHKKEALTPQHMTVTPKKQAATASSMLYREEQFHDR
jgi:hypothetical protein